MKWWIASTILFLLYTMALLDKEEMQIPDVVIIPKDICQPYTRSGWGVFDAAGVEWYGQSLTVARDACMKYGKAPCYEWIGD